MNTPKNWTPPPEMPAELPPLSIGRNGKTLVYAGIGPLSVLTYGGYYSNSSGEWEGAFDGSWPYHYAAESDSEICRLNQWGDFDPRNKAVELVKPQTMIQLYRQAANDSRDYAKAQVEKLCASLKEWNAHLAQCEMICTQLEPVNPNGTLERKAWYYKGRRDERHHAKQRTTFPALPD